MLPVKVLPQQFPSLLSATSLTWNNSGKMCRLNKDHVLPVFSSAPAIYKDISRDWCKLRQLLSSKENGSLLPCFSLLFIADLCCVVIGPTVRS